MLSFNLANRCSTMHIKREGSGRSELVYLCLHIKKGKGHFDTFNAHFHFAQFLISLHLSKKGRCRLIYQKLMHLQCTMSYIFDWEVRRLGMRERVKTRNVNGLRIWIFSQKLPFSVGKKCFKDFKKYNTLYLYVI